MKSNQQTKEIWNKILGYQVGQKIRIVTDCWFSQGRKKGRKLKGRKGVIMKIGYDTSHSFVIYYTKVNWIEGMFQFIKEEFDPI